MNYTYFDILETTEYTPMDMDMDMDLPQMMSACCLKISSHSRVERRLAEIWVSAGK